MDFIFLGLKEEDQWEVLRLSSKKMKKEQFSLELQIKDNYLSVIGEQDLLMRLEAKMTQLLVTGIKKEATDQLLRWIFFHLMKILFSLYMIIIFVFGKQMLKFLFLQVLSAKDASTHADAGVKPEVECFSLVNRMVQLIFGISWINLISGQCNIQ